MIETWHAYCYPIGFSISLSEIEDSTVTIRNNTLSGYQSGLSVEFVNGCKILNNRFEECDISVSLAHADNTLITGNTFQDVHKYYRTYVDAEDAKNLTLTQNHFSGSRGNIVISGSSESFVGRNTMNNVSFSVYSSSKIVFSNNTGNKLSVKFVYSNNASITSNIGYELSCFQSPFTKIQHNDFGDYFFEELSIENYQTYILDSNKCGEGLFNLFVNYNFLNHNTMLNLYSQVLYVNCSNIWLENYNGLKSIAKIDLINCSDISFLNNVCDLELYFYGSKNVTISQSFIIQLIIKFSEDVSLFNNTLAETEIICEYTYDLEILENYFYQNSLYLDDCVNISITENLVFNGIINGHGNSNYSVLSNDFVMCENGLFLSDSLDVIISDNKFVSIYGLGPTMFENENFIFHNNSISGAQCGFYLGVRPHEYLPQVTNNFVNSKPLGYYVNQNNLTLEGLSFGQLIISNCSSIIVKDITISNTRSGLSIFYSENISIENLSISSCDDGIWVRSSENLKISDSQLFGCSSSGISIGIVDIVSLSNNTCDQNWVGMSLSSADFVLITNNTFVRNYDGMILNHDDYVLVQNNSFIENSNRGLYLDGIDDCNIVFNLFFNNTGYGMYIYRFSEGNSIHHNAFIENNNGGTSQAFDWDGTNEWADYLSLQGNFWNTWSGVGSYQIDYITENVEDPYPLVTNPLE
ncbi:MAG: NosD domain-containing protein [Candidatus Heimdallarchaeaceae archaeon]